MHFIIFILAAIFLSFEARAGLSCHELVQSAEIQTSVEWSQHRPLVFTNTEVHRRNNNMGQQQVGELRLDSWFELPPYDSGFYNFVGITKGGQIYHVIDWEGHRRIARLLSGTRLYVELYLLNGQLLVAQDQNGDLFVYSPEVWRKSPLKKIVKQAMAFNSLLFISATSIFYSMAPSAVEELLFPIVASVIGVSTSLQTSFWALFKYERLNTYPDGFIKTAWNRNDSIDAEVAVRQIDERFVEGLSLSRDMLPPDLINLPPPVEAATESIR